MSQPRRGGGRLQTTKLWRLAQGRVEAGDVAEFRRALMVDPCAYCGRAADVLDHVVAKIRGGADALENRTPACALCNARKRDTSLLGFLAGVVIHADHAVLLAEAAGVARWIGDYRAVAR